jgi:hypothetical protein
VAESIKHKERDLEKQLTQKGGKVMYFTDLLWHAAKSLNKEHRGGKKESKDATQNSSTAKHFGWFGYHERQPQAIVYLQSTDKS